MLLTQTDIQREIYEGREKARRDERAKMHDALEKGMAEGIEKGVLIGRIEMLQQVLKLDATPRPELESMSLEALTRLTEELKRQLG